MSLLHSLEKCFCFLSCGEEKTGSWMIPMVINFLEIHHRHHEHYFLVLLQVYIMFYYHVLLVLCSYRKRMVELLLKLKLPHSSSSVSICIKVKRRIHNKNECISRYSNITSHFKHRFVTRKVSAAITIQWAYMKLKLTQSRNALKKLKTIQRHRM